MRVVVDEVPACPAPPDAPAPPAAPPAPPAWTPATVRNSPRGDLLAEITGGFHLKPVKDEEKTATIEATDSPLALLIKHLSPLYDAVQGEVEAESDVDDDWD